LLSSQHKGETKPRTLSELFLNLDFWKLLLQREEISWRY